MNKDVELYGLYFENSCLMVDTLENCWSKLLADYKDNTVAYLIHKDVVIKKETP